MNDDARISPSMRGLDMTGEGEAKRQGESLWLRSLEKLATDRAARREAFPRELEELFIREKDRAVAQSAADVENFERTERAKLKKYEEESLRLLEKANEEAQERTRGALEEDIAADVARALRAILGREDVAP